MINDTDVFSQYMTQDTRHVVFDPIINFKGLSEQKMDNHLKHDHFRTMKPWMLLSELIAIPVVTIGLVVTMHMPLIQKFLLIILLIVHIIILTCLISYMSKLKSDAITNNTTLTTHEQQ